MLDNDVNRYGGDKMTNQEAKRVLEAVLFCANAEPKLCVIGDCDHCKGYVGPEEDVDAYNLALEALEKNDKYGWHDLKENPDDLPPDNYEGDVLVSLYGIDGHIHYKHGIKLAYWCGRKYSFFDDESNYLVEAWKHLEPFKEDD